MSSPHGNGGRRARRRRGGRPEVGGACEDSDSRYVPRSRLALRAHPISPSRSKRRTRSRLCRRPTGVDAKPHGGRWPISDSTCVSAVAVIARCGRYRSRSYANSHNTQGTPTSCASKFSHAAINNGQTSDSRNSSTCVTRPSDGMRSAFPHAVKLIARCRGDASTLNESSRVLRRSMRRGCRWPLGAALRRRRRGQRGVGRSSGRGDLRPRRGCHRWLVR